MRRPAGVISKQVSSKARQIARYLQRIERLHRKGFLSARDAERAYCGAYLDFHAFLEQQMQRFFIGLLTRRLACSGDGGTPLVRVKSNRVAVAVVLGERKYVDWIPYEKYALARARAFFSRGRPFSNLGKLDVEAFNESAVIRNALAHGSAAAVKTFRRQFIDNRFIPPTQEKPGSYLRGYHTAGQTRLEHHLARSVAAFNLLCR